MSSLKPRWRQLVASPWRRAARLGRTIRGRILLSFLATSVITFTLGAVAITHIREAGTLVERTYDRSLMSINYARAASADFAAMRAALAKRWIVLDPEVKLRLAHQAETLRKSVLQDLAIAASRAQSDRAQEEADGAVHAIGEWSRMREQVSETATSLKDWTDVEALAAKVDGQIDMLVRLTASDGLSFRRQAEATVDADIRTNLLGIVIAVFVAAAVSWFLDRRIIGPVGVASDVALQIAQGKLDIAVPRASIDELGTLLSAMDVMRGNLREMVAREVGQRQSAQTRLADALASSPEGIVVVDATGHIALANDQFANFLGLSTQVVAPGTPFATVAQAAGGSALFEHALTVPSTRDARMQEMYETQLADGRWLRISWSATQEGGFVAVIGDISILKEQKERLKATNFRLDAALANMSQGLCLFDAAARLMVVNRQFGEIFGLDATTLQPGCSLVKVLELKIAAGALDPDLDARAYAAQFHATAQAKAGTFLEELLDGRAVAVAHQPVEDGGWVATFEDITERRQVEEQIAFMAQHDALTRLANRATFRERVEAALPNAFEGRGFALMCLDLDRFKPVNDTLGHPVGDAVLRIIAERLGTCVRAGDTVARLGGDEFAILQPDVQGAEDVAFLAQRIIDVVSRPIAFDGHNISVGVSIGIAIAPSQGTTVTDLMKNADAALYQAKGEGRGIWRAFEPALDERLQARLRLEMDLRQALATGQFELHYQPIYDLREARICGFEALLRWHHPKRGWISPSEFIPIAEAMGLIVPLGEWVVRTACAEAARWPDELKLSINVSSVQFRSDQLVSTIRQATEVSGIPHSRIELEITESVLLEDDEAILRRLHSLRELGLRFSMDDFGTGYSSLSSLRSFPFAKIKIDQTFIRDLVRKSESAIIVRAITGLGSSLGMLTTAEGVETREQFLRLRQEGCDEIQGHYISAAVPPHRIPEILARWNAATEAA